MRVVEQPILASRIVRNVCRDTTLVLWAGVAIGFSNNHPYWQSLPVQQSS